MEIENAFECAKIVDASAPLYHSGSGVAAKAAAIGSEPREAGCASVKFASVFKKALNKKYRLKSA